MLKYIEQTIDENVTNQDIDTIHHFVKKVKCRREVGINYMKSWELEQMYHEEGREEGRKEGIRALIGTCQEFQISREDTLAKIMYNFKLEPHTAETYMQKYWAE